MSNSTRCLPYLWDKCFIVCDWCTNIILPVNPSSTSGKPSNWSSGSANSSFSPSFSLSSSNPTLTSSSQLTAHLTRKRDLIECSNPRAGNYIFKGNNRNTRTRCEICSKLTIKTPERRHWRCCGVFIVDFEHISHLVLVFPSLILVNVDWLKSMIDDDG